jgi:hypothetical protein
MRDERSSRHFAFDAFRAHHGFRHQLQQQGLALPRRPREFARPRGGRAHLWTSSSSILCFPVTADFHFVTSNARKVETQMGSELTIDTSHIFSQVRVDGVQEINGGQSLLSTLRNL